MIMCKCETVTARVRDTVWVSVKKVRVGERECNGSKRLSEKKRARNMVG